jgi:hypothetical protein
MANTEVRVNEQDLASVLQKKIGEAVNLQLQMEAMARVIAEQDAKIAGLEGQVSSSNGKEDLDAGSREEKVPIHSQG